MVVAPAWDLAIGRLSAAACRPDGTDAGLPRLPSPDREHQPRRRGRENVDANEHRPGRRRRPMRRRASGTSCSPTSPATRASCPASRRRTGSTSAAASRPPTRCSVPSWTPSSRAWRPSSPSSSSRAMPSSRPRRRRDSMARVTGSSRQLAATYRAFIDAPHPGHPLERPRLYGLPGRRPPRPQGGAPSGPRGPPDGRVRQRPARPGRDGRPSIAQEHRPRADRLPSLPVHDRRRGDRARAVQVGISHGEEYPDVGEITGASWSWAVPMFAPVADDEAPGRRSVAGAV